MPMLRPIESEELKGLLASEEIEPPKPVSGSIRPLSEEEFSSLVDPALAQNWHNTAGVNPDVEAEDQSLAERNGWPLWMVQRKPENKQLAKANVEMPDWAKVSKDYPTTANFLGIPENMALSRDDVEALKKIEDLPKSGVSRIVSEAWLGMKETSTMQQYADLATEKIMGGTLTPEKEEQLASLDAQLDEGDNANPAFKGIGNLAQFFLGPLSKASRNLIPMTLLGGLGMVATSKGGTSGELLKPVAPLLSSVPLAIDAITQTTMRSQLVKDSMKLESSLLYRDLTKMTDENGVLLSETVGEDVLRTVAMLSGGMAGAVEALPMEYFAQQIPGVKQMTSRAMFKAIMKHPTARGALVSFIKNYVIGVGLESGTEAVQRGITKAGEEFIKAYARSKGVQAEMDSFDDWGRDLGQEFVGALQSFSLAMVPVPGMTFVSDMNAVKRSEQQQQMFVDIAEALSESKLQQRSPKAMKDFVSRAFKGTDFESTFVDAEALTTYFQEAGVSIEEGAEALGTTPEAIRDAVIASDKVELSTGDWATKVAGTPLGDALAGDVTFDPETPTGREAEVVRKEAAEIQKRDVEKAEQMIAENDALQADLDYARSSFLTMATAAGVDATEATQSSTLIGARLKVGMARYGINPREAYDSMGLVIQSEAGDFVTADGTSYNQDGELNLNENFQAWFGESKVVDEEGKPLVVHHWSPNKALSVFNPMSHFGTKQAAADRAEYMTEEGAEVGGKSYPVYLNIQNPIQVEDRGYNTPFALFIEAAMEYGSAALEGDEINPLSVYPEMVASWVSSLSDEEFRTIKEHLNEDGVEIEDADSLSEYLSEAIDNYGLKEAAFLVEELAGLEERDEGELAGDFSGASKILGESVASFGFDGFSYRNQFEDKGSMSYVPLFPNQIKSVYNEGTWSGKTEGVYNQDGELNLNENFRAWFGESKVVDEEGKPLVVYHGTDVEFDEFRFGQAVGFGTGGYLTDLRDEAEDHGSSVREFYVSIQNPASDADFEQARLEIMEDVDARLEAAQTRYEEALDAGADPDVLSAIETEKEELQRESVAFEEIEDSDITERVRQSLEAKGFDGIIADLQSGREGKEIVAFSPEQIKSTRNEGTWSGKTGNVYKQISKPVRDYAAKNTGWSEMSSGVWGMLEALNDFDSRISALVGQQMSSPEELGSLFKEDAKARSDWETFIPEAAKVLGVKIVPFNKDGSVNKKALNVIFRRKSELPKALKDKVGVLVAGHGRANAFELNKVLGANPDMRAEIERLQERIDDMFGITPLIDDKGITTTGIERRHGEYGSGRPNPYKPKFGGFARSFSQTFLDSLPDKVFELFRAELVQAVEHAYANGGNGIPGVKFMDRPLDTVSKSDFKLAQVIKKAEKTVGALNLNSNCPMFMIGSHGCYLDGCYVTGMGMGGNTINFYVRGAYTGELLQLSQEDVELLNSVGGLRLNGMGDLVDAQYLQFKDIVRHAKMRGLKLKVISKQDGTLRMLQKMHDEGIDIDGVQAQVSIDPYWIPIQEDELADSLATVQGLVRSREKSPDNEAIAQTIIGIYASQGREAKVIDGVLMRKYGYSFEKIDALHEQCPDVQILKRAVVGTPEEIVHYARYHPDVLQTWMHAAIRKGMYSDVAGRMLNEGEVGNFTTRIAVYRDADGEWRVRAQAQSANEPGGDFVFKATKKIRALRMDRDKAIARGQDLSAIDEKIASLRKEQERVINTRADGIPLKVREGYTKVEEYIKTQPDGDALFATLAGSLEGDPSAMCCGAGADKDACNNCTSHCHAGSRGWQGDPVKVEAMADLLAEVKEQKKRDKVEAYAQAVWHGSPHRFSKFTLDHIGAGEGAQAYGWGLYFAGSRQVAEWYREKLTPQNARYSYKGKKITKASVEKWRRRMSEVDISDGDRYSEALVMSHIVSSTDSPRTRRQLRGILEEEASRDHLKNESENYAEALKWFDEHSTDFGFDEGQLYKADIPEDDVMLDWDKPLSEQPEKVREAIEEAESSDYLDWAKKEGAEGRRLYKGISRAQGSDQAASEYLNSLGIKGIKYLDGNSRSAGEGNHNYVIFDDEAISVLETYYQQQGDVHGQTDFSDGKTIISLFESADRSTLIHEMGHVFLENLRNMAEDNDLARADLDAFNAWLGVDEWGSLTDEQRINAHEKFARTFEAYLMDGRAPSVGLKRVFASFKQWLVAIYRDIAGLSAQAGQNIEVSDEARDLFDRLLATEDEIEEARNLADYESAVEATPESAEMHRNATDRAKEQLGTDDAPTMKEKRKKLTGQIRAELSATRGYKALADLKKPVAQGGIKVNDDEIVETYSDNFLMDVIVPMGISSKTSAWSLDDVAFQYGYSSGDEMIQEITQLEPIGKAVKARVDSQIKAEARPSKEEARGALRNEDRIQALAVERENLENEMLPEPQKGNEPEWLEILEEAEAEKDNPVSREKVLAAVKAEGKISYDALIALWGPDEAKTLMKRLGPGMFSRKGLGLDVIAQELQSKGVPLKGVQHLYDILMEPKKEERALDVAVEPTSLSWLVWMLGYKDAAKYVRKRRRTVKKALAEAEEAFEADRDDASRQAMVEAQKELDYIAKALKVTVRPEDKTKKTDDDSNFEVDFDPETFETVEGRVEWDQPTVAEAIEGQADPGTDPATMKDAWTLASRISRIAHREGMKEGRKRAAEAKKKIRDRAKANVEAHNNWKKKQRDTVNARVEAAKVSARRAIEKKKASSLKPAVYLAAERRAKRNVERALKSNNFDEATRQKDLQIINAALAEEADRTKREMEKDRKYFKRMAKYKYNSSISNKELEQIHNMLDKVNLRSGKKAREQQAEALSFEEWKAEQENMGNIVVVPSRLQKILGTTPFSDMAVESVRDLNDAIKNIEHLGRLKGKLLTDQKKRRFEEVQEELEETAKKLGEKHLDSLDPNVSRKEEAISKVHKLDAALVRMEALLQELDGDVPLGPFYQAFMKPIYDAQNMEFLLLEEARESLKGLFSRLDMKGLHKKHFYAELNLSLSKENLLCYALNMGNQGNLARLMNGQHLSEVQVEFIKNQLTESDWEWVQSVWDYIGSYWSAIEALEKRVSGVAPKRVEAFPVVTKYGVFPGGYYPIAYNPLKSSKAARQEERKKLEEFAQNSYVKAQTRHGHTEARLGHGGRQLRLGDGALSVIAEHVTQVIHDLSFREAVIDTNKLIGDERISGAIRAALGKEYESMFRPWLQHVAAGNYRPITGWEELLMRAKNGVTVGLLGLNPGTIAIQALSVFGGSEAIGQKAMLASIAEYTHKPLAWKRKAEFVKERSVEMRNRSRTWNRELREMTMDLTKMNKATKVQSSLFYFHGLMDAAACIPLWLKSYEMKLSETGSEGTAVEFADHVVRTTQPASNPKDLPTIMREKGAMRLFTMFYSYFNIYYNMMRRRLKLTHHPMAVPRLVATLMWTTVVPVILAAQRLGRGPDEDEEDLLGWYLKSILMYPVNSVVGVRDIASAVGSGYSYQLSPVAVVGQSTVRAITQLGTLLGAIGDDDWEIEAAKLAKPAFETIGFWSGIIPVRTVEKTVAPLLDYIASETSNRDLRNLLARRRE